MDVVDANNPNLLAIANPGSITDYQWNADSNAEFVYSTKNAINLFSPQTSQTTIVAQNNYISWYLDHGSLWTLTQPTSTPGELLITSDALGFSSYFAIVPPETAANDTWNIVYAEHQTVLLQNQQHTAMLLVTPEKIYPLSTSNFFVSPYNDWWLLWSTSELWTYSAGSAPSLLERSGETLENVAPLDEYNTLALTWETKTTALFPYYFTGHDFLTSPVTSIVTDPKDKTLYFTDKEGLWQLQY